MIDPEWVLWVVAYCAVSVLIIGLLIGVLLLLNRKANTAIKKADYVEKKLLELKYR